MARFGQPRDKISVCALQSPKGSNFLKNRGFQHCNVINHKGSLRVFTRTSRTPVGNASCLRYRKKRMSFGRFFKVTKTRTKFVTPSRFSRSTFPL